MNTDKKEKMAADEWDERVKNKRIKNKE